MLGFKNSGWFDVIDAKTALVLECIGSEHDAVGLNVKYIM